MSNRAGGDARIVSVASKPHAEGPGLPAHRRRPAGQQGSGRLPLLRSIAQPLQGQSECACMSENIWNNGDNCSQPCLDVCVCVCVCRPWSVTPRRCRRPEVRTRGQPVLLSAVCRSVTLKLANNRTTGHTDIDLPDLPSGFLIKLKCSRTQYPVYTTH